MYGKIFEQMYDGTLAQKGPWQALVTFQQMIVLADKQGVVDMTADAISRRTTIPLDVIEIGITALMEPDAGSRTPEEDGRRIVLLSDHRDWGWRVVNYEKYAAIRSAEERREYHRLYARARKTQHDSTIPTVSTDVTVSVPLAVNEDEKKTALSENEPVEFDLIWKSYPKRAGGNSRGSALKAYKARRREGVPPDEMALGVVRYATYIKVTGKWGSEFVKVGATFFGPDRHWEEAWTLPVAVPTKDNGKPAWQAKKEMAERDEYLNKRQDVQDFVVIEIDRHDVAWYDEMKRQATSAGRWVVPYIFDQIKGGSNGKS